jgi:acetate CoA/acetoacetate CoA-transferase alpha subunit
MEHDMSVKKAIALRNAMAMIPDGATVMIGGFFGVGTPHRMIDALVEFERGNLTLIVHDTARPGIGISLLIERRLVRKVITTHIGTNPETQRQMLSGELVVEFVPLGTFVERIRAGGCGLGGVLTPVGLGTEAAANKQIVEVDGNLCLLEKPLRAEYALIQAKRADYRGNLDYTLTARNVNPVMARAADTVIVEATEIVPVGMITPDNVITPHVLVDYLIKMEAPSWEHAS